MLSRLWQSTEQFHRRIRQRLPLLHETLEPFHEEYDEVELAFHRVEGKLAEECADLLVTTIGMMLSAGVTYEQFMAAIEDVACKNDRKDLTNCTVLPNGKIKRIK